MCPAQYRKPKSHPSSSGHPSHRKGKQDLVFRQCTLHDRHAASAYRRLSQDQATVSSRRAAGKHEHIPQTGHSQKRNVEALRHETSFPGGPGFHTMTWWADVQGWDLSAKEYHGKASRNGVDGDVWEFDGGQQFQDTIQIECKGSLKKMLKLTSWCIARTFSTTTSSFIPENDICQMDIWKLCPWALWKKKSNIRKVLWKQNECLRQRYNLDITWWKMNSRTIGVFEFECLWSRIIPQTSMQNLWVTEMRIQPGY